MRRTSTLSLGALACALTLLPGGRPASAKDARLNPKAEELIQQLNGRGVRYSQRQELLSRLERLGKERALPSIRRAVLAPSRVQRKRRDDLLPLLARFEGPESLEILRQALGFTLLRRDEVKDPARLLRALRGLSEETARSPAGDLWRRLGASTQRLVKNLKLDPKPALVEAVVARLREVQRDPGLYDAKRLKGVDLPIDGLLVGFERLTKTRNLDSVGYSIQYALNRLVLETLLPGQFEPVRLIPTLKPRLISAAYEVLVQMATDKRPGAKELLLEADHVPRVTRMKGLSRLPGFGSVRILVDQLFDSQPQVSSLALMSLRAWIEKDSASVVSALTFKRGELSKLAEAKSPSLGLVLIACSEAEAYSILAEALRSSQEELAQRTFDFVLERPELLAEPALQRAIDDYIRKLGEEGLPTQARLRLYRSASRSKDPLFWLPFLMERVADPSPQARSAVFAALSQLSGVTEVEHTSAAWQAWWAKHQATTPPEE